MAQGTLESPVRTVETSTARLAYRDVGRGPVLLCLHGTGPGASGWGNYAAVAEIFSSEFRVIVPDLPGFGDSQITRDDEMPWAQMSALQLIEFLDQIGIERAHVIGNSAGGSVAAHLAVRKPEAVASLVLMGCAGLRVPMFTPKELEGVKLLRNYRPNPTLEKMRAIIHAFLYDPSIIDVEAVARARYEETLRTETAAGPARITRDRPRSLQLTPEDLAKIEAETLLIWGRDDRFVGVDDAFAFLAFIANARLVLLPKCGHWVQVERQADFVAQVRGFVSMIESKKR